MEEYIFKKFISNSLAVCTLLWTQITNVLLLFKKQITWDFKKSIREFTSLSYFINVLTLNWKINSLGWTLNVLGS